MGRRLTVLAHLALICFTVSWTPFRVDASRGLWYHVHVVIIWRPQSINDMTIFITCECPVVHSCVPFVWWEVPIWRFTLRIRTTMTHFARQGWECRWRHVSMLTGVGSVVDHITPCALSDQGCIQGSDKIWNTPVFFRYIGRLCIRTALWVSCLHNLSRLFYKDSILGTIIAELHGQALFLLGTRMDPISNRGTSLTTPKWPFYSANLKK